MGALNRFLIFIQQIWIFNRPVMVDLPPATIYHSENSRCSNGHVKNRFARSKFPALSAYGIEYSASYMKVIIVELKVELGLSAEELLIHTFNLSRA
jgi:hypothetical protein